MERPVIDFGEKKGTVGVTTLPGNKRPSLVHIISNKYCAQIYPLASFRNQEAADHFEKLLNDSFEQGARNGK